MQRNKGLFYLNINLLDVNLSLIVSNTITFYVINIIMGRDYSFLIKKINKIIENKKGKILDTFFLLNNKEKIEELCELIKIFIEKINHVYKKFNIEKFDFVSKCIVNLNTKSNDNILFP